MLLRSAAGGGGKKVLLRVSVFWTFVAAFPSNVGIYVLVGMELRYLLTFHMSRSSTLLTKFCHIFRLDSSTLCWKIFWFFFHLSSSSHLSYLINLRRDRCTCFHRISISLFLHTKSIVVFAGMKVIVPAGSIGFNCSWDMMSISTSASGSQSWWFDGFHSG